MARVLVPLAQGCEEIEAVTVIDLLRRAGIEVVAAGLDRSPVVASRGTRLLPDTDLDEALGRDYDMVVLPGGQPGADHLEADARIRALLQRSAAQGKWVAAICAAPKVLASAGVLEGRRATSFPGALDPDGVSGMTLVADDVVRDGNVITSRGPGTAMDFALTLIEVLAGRATRERVESTLQRPRSAQPAGP
jgi:4-methyl-5(b-hydroxyethyl)-thiazole monophosphate biosynthesis